MIINAKNTNYQSFRTDSFDSRHDDKEDKKLSAGAHAGIALTSIVATLLPIAIIRKYQHKALNFDVFKSESATIAQKGKEALSFFNINYGIKEMLFVGASSLVGGLFGGMIFDKNDNHKKKANEAVYKMSNIVIPTVMVGALLAGAKKLNFNGILSKIGAIVLGIGAGMPISCALSNKINEKTTDEDEFEKRHLKPTDYLVHIDDVAGALILARIPMAEKLQLDKFLSAIYAYGGYEAGSAGRED